MSTTDQRDGVHSKSIHEVEQRRKVAPHVSSVQAHLWQQVIKQNKDVV